MNGMATESDITSAVEANNEQFNLKIKDVNGKYIELKETLDGVTVTTETGKPSSMAVRSALTTCILPGCYPKQALRAMLKCWKTD